MIMQTAKHRFRLVVFDWDGTLSDSQARIVECLSAAARDAGLPVLPSAIFSNVIGLGLREAIAALYPAAGGEDHARFADRYRYHYVVGSQTPTPLFAGARELLHGLRQRGTYLAVATGKGRRGLDRALVEHGFDAVLHASRCADETLSTPHPQLPLDIMDRPGADAQDALMAGDTEYDIVMAHNAGAAAVGETYGVHDRDRLLALRPFACAESKAELTRWIDACEWPLFEGIF